MHPSKAYEVMYAHGCAIFWASMNLNGSLSKIVRVVSNGICARVQVNFAQGTVGKDGVCGRTFVLLIVADKVFDCRRDAIVLQAFHVGSGQGT